MAGGSYRGPVAHGRQTRTIRLMQILFVLIALGLAAYALATLRFAEGDLIGGRHDPGNAQPIVLLVLAAGSLAAARALGGKAGVRIPTPARLEELVGRAEKAAVERAEQIAAEPRPDEQIG